MYNNYFNFFRHIYIYYIWLDKKNQYFKYKNIHYESNYALKLLSKLLQKKYNNYYFRNILLKRIFNYKYNYLKFLQKSKIFNDYLVFQNLDNILSLNLHFNDSNIQNKNYFINELFKYVYTLIFKYYIYLLKNYYLNTVDIKLNNYIYYFIFNQKIFKLINIKNKLNNYVNLNYNSIVIINLNNNNNTFTLELDVDKNNKMIRFDPDDIGRITIDRFEISLGVDKINNYTIIGGKKYNNKIIFSTIDPQILIPINVESKQKLTIYFNYDDLYVNGGELLEDTINDSESKDREIKSLKDELQMVYNSKSWKMTKWYRRLRDLIKN